MVDHRDEEWIEIEDDGFVGFVGPIFHKPFDKGIGRFRFIGEAKHKNRNGFIHGGMLMTFADRALGMTARQGLSRSQATVQLDVHFVRPAMISKPIDMECRILRQTASLIFMDGTITSDSEVVATARGVWKTIKA
ncbi:PaaI family thioesterase [Microvirga sp. P5_D2]